jgi:hypothetical protein
VVIWYISPFLEYCNKKNLATLVAGNSVSTKTMKINFCRIGAGRDNISEVVLSNFLALGRTYNNKVMGTMYRTDAWKTLNMISEYYFHPKRKADTNVEKIDVEVCSSKTFPS